jgi:thioesterase domain-containing protein
LGQVTLEISQDAVEVFLRTKLPDYMIPSLHVFLDEFPLTTSGKLDRIALPKPDWGSMGRRQEYLAPRNPTEQRLVKLWGGLLGRSQIGVRDDFFELGGHSLLAVRLPARMEAEFGILLPLTWFLDTATVERMARSLTHIDSTGESATLVKLHDGDGRDPLFIVTAGYGDMLALGRIAAYMSLDSPIYGLQPPGEWIGGEVRNLRDLIEAYLQAIHEVHSDNSYRLAGYCSGGLVAYELARQARKAGYEIEKLILLETPFSYRRHIHALYIKLRSLLNRFLQGPDKTQWRLSTVLRALFVDEGLAQHLEVLAGYKALDYDGSLILIQAQWSHIRFIARKSKWKGVSTGSVERVIVSGDHDNIIRGQRADELARQIGRALHE